MRDKLEVVARPKGVIEAFMLNALVCRTSPKTAAAAYLARPLVANHAH
jgi:hypothetical protein